MRDIKLFLRTIVLSQLAVLLIVATCFLLLKLTGLTITSWGDIGSMLAGVAAVPGFYFLVQTFNLQRTQKYESDVERAFAMRCESIEIGLKNIKTPSNKMEGQHAIATVADLCTKGSIKHQKAIRDLNCTQLNSVSAALSDLEEWLMENPTHLKLRTIFRVRYVGLVLNLEKIVPPEVWKMTEDEYFMAFANDNELFMSIGTLQRLKSLDFDCDIKYMETFESHRLSKRKPKTPPTKSTLES